MKKVRRGLALLVAALVVVNSTDFSLLTVNAKEQTAQESDAQALKTGTKRKTTRRIRAVGQSPHPMRRNRPEIL